MDEPAYGHEPQWVEPTSLADVAPPPGLAMSSSVPSKGSAAHGTGLCRPCAWLWKPGGCQNGAECRHCHLCPDGELKARRKVKAELARQESLEQERVMDCKQSPCISIYIIWSAIRNHMRHVTCNMYICSRVQC